MFVTCPFCHKKLYVRKSQLIFKGRLSVGCPICHRAVYQALRKQLLAVQGIMVLAAVLICARLGQMNVPGGTFGKILLLIAGIILVMALSEVCTRWVSRQSLLQQRTDKMLRREKEAEEARKAQERAANRKKKKHAKK